MYRKNNLTLSTLGHTWIFDIDGTIVKHNGYKNEGEDIFLDGAKEFLNRIPDKDMIIFLTARTDEYQEQTINFLKNNKIRYNHIIFNAPQGERILINDNKPSGTEMGVAINMIRDSEMQLEYIIDSKK